VGQAVNDAKGGKVDFRVEKAGVVHAGIGKVSFSEEAIVDNLTTLVETLYKLKPASAKGTYLRSIAISATQGPGIRVNPGSIIEL
jgi:large subunit ribosomal protein L1